jgi:molybdopterin molybdotransferase
LKKYSCELIFYQQIPDEPKIFFQLMQNLLEQHPDIILTTGAVSVGVYDFIKSVLTDLKVNVHFHKVAIRPGKPLLFASYEKTVLFSMPGNPISTAVAMRFFVEPYLRLIQNTGSEFSIRLPLATSIKKPDGLICFYKAILVPGVGENEVTRIDASLDQGSAVVSSFMHAQYWVKLNAEKNYYKENTVVEVYPL